MKPAHTSPMDDTLHDACLRIPLAAGAGGLIGCVAAVLLDPSSGFVLWGGLLWLLIGAASVGCGVAAGYGVSVLSAHLAPGVHSTWLQGVATLSAAVVGGLVAGALLSATSSVVVPAGSALFAVTAAAFTLAVTLQRRRRRPQRRQP